jgi:hypothetical protein
METSNCQITKKCRNKPEYIIKFRKDKLGALRACENCYKKLYTNRFCWVESINGKPLKPNDVSEEK